MHEAAEICIGADLLNVFETFLPQLLLYPNPTDPLNGEAAALLMREPEAYNHKVRGRRKPKAALPTPNLAMVSHLLGLWLTEECLLAEYVQRFAKQEQLSNGTANGKEEDMEESDGFLSSSDDEDDPPTTGVADI